MSAHTTGRVWVVDATAPAPPSAPYDGGYRGDCCRSGLGSNAMPADLVADQIARHPGFVGVFCTRPSHPDTEVHACHLREAGQVHAVVIWGGE